MKMFIEQHNLNSSNLENNSSSQIENADLQLSSINLDKGETSMLPYYITYHRKSAGRLFEHARSKEHGLKHLDIRKGVLALFWLITFLIVMSILIYMVTDLIRKYALMPVATQIKVESDKLLFPDVSICAKTPFYVNNQFNSSNYSYDDNQNLDDNITNIDELLRSIQKSVEKKFKDSSIRINKASLQSSLLIQMATRKDDRFLRAFQHLIYCRYNDKECSFFNFTEIVHLRYIQCFTFSPNERVISGNRGLQFIFYKYHKHTQPFLMLNDLEDEDFVSNDYDGINVLIHNPNTFPTYSISSMPTSFSLRFGQLAKIDLSSLRYHSDMSGRKACKQKRDSYRYTNFRSGAKYLEYHYTYEDCIANMKQKFIYDNCECYSDRLFVPFKGSDYSYHKSTSSMSSSSSSSSSKLSSEFCRDIRAKTSQTTREQFLCYELYSKMPATSVLDQYIPPDKLYMTRNDPDARKIGRHKICSLLCQQLIYATRFFEVTDLSPDMTFPITILTNYIHELEISKLRQPELQKLWNNMINNKLSKDEQLHAKDMIIVDIRASTELIDTWEEELTESVFHLISNLGGTLGLCAGISFVSSLFLIIFFGRAFLHALLSFVLWFWWALYLGKPPPRLSTQMNLDIPDKNNPNVEYNSKYDKNDDSMKNKNDDDEDGDEDDSRINKDDEKTTLPTSSDDNYKYISNEKKENADQQDKTHPNDLKRINSDYKSNEGTKLFRIKTPITYHESDSDLNQPQSFKNKSIEKLDGVNNFSTDDISGAIALRDPEDIYHSTPKPQPPSHQKHNKVTELVNTHKNEQPNGELLQVRRLDKENVAIGKLKKSNSMDIYDWEQLESDSESHKRVKDAAGVNQLITQNYEQVKYNEDTDQVDKLFDQMIRMRKVNEDERKRTKLKSVEDLTNKNKQNQWREDEFWYENSSTNEDMNLKSKINPTKGRNLNISEYYPTNSLIYNHPITNKLNDKLIRTPVSGSSSDMSSFIYQPPIPPPPPLIVQSIDEKSGRKIFLPDQDMNTDYYIRPIIDQKLVPNYLRQNYGYPPPYRLP